MRNTMQFEEDVNGYTKLIHLKTGKYALIDTEMKDALESWMQSNGAFVLSDGGFRQASGKRYRLITVLAALDNEVDVETVAAMHKVYPKNGDQLDCRKENISFLNHWDIPDSKLIYDSTYNAIYQWGINTILLLKDDGIVAKFDARDYIVRLLINMIKNGYIIRKAPKAPHITVRLGSNGRWERLASHLLQSVYSVPLDMIEKSKITYVDQDETNLCVENIVSSAVPAAHNKNRYIKRIGNDVYIWAGENNKPDITDCADIMEPIMKNPAFSWTHKSDGRLGSVTKVDGKSLGFTDLYLHQLRWAVECYGAKDDYYSVIDAMRRMRSDFKQQNLNIDHLDSNHRNNRLWNLACMTSRQNSNLKNNLTSLIFAPFFWVSVALGRHNGYRVFCGTEEDPRLYFCETTDDYINLLRRFFSNGFDAICPPMDIEEGRRLFYEQDGQLTDEGDRIIQLLLTTENTKFVDYKSDGKNYEISRKMKLA